MDLRDVYGYGKIIRNDDYFPAGCESDNQRKQFLRCWFDKIVELGAEQYPKTRTGSYGRYRKPSVWVNNQRCPDGSGACCIDINPRHNYGIVEQGYCPEDIYITAKNWAWQRWNMPVLRRRTGENN